MRRARLWVPLLAVLVGLGAAAASAGGPTMLPPKALGLLCTGPGAAISCDGHEWISLSEPGAPTGLWLNSPMFVRGPARILVDAGAIVVVPDGGVVRASWDPAARGWRFEAWKDNASVAFANGCFPLCEGRAITLYDGEEGGYRRGHKHRTKRYIEESGGFITVLGAQGQ